MSLLIFFARLADWWSVKFFSFTATIRKPPLLCLRFATCFPSCQSFHKCRLSMEKSVSVPFDCKISFRTIQPKFAVSFLMNQFIALLPFTFVGTQKRNKKWLEPFLLVGLVWFFGGERGQVVGCWTCNLEVPGFKSSLPRDGFVFGGPKFNSSRLCK